MADDDVERAARGALRVSQIRNSLRHAKNECDKNPGAHKLIQFSGRFVTLTSRQHSDTGHAMRQHSRGSGIIACCQPQVCPKSPGRHNGKVIVSLQVKQRPISSNHAIDPGVRGASQNFLIRDAYSRWCFGDRRRNRGQLNIAKKGKHGIGTVRRDTKFAYDIPAQFGENRHSKDHLMINQQRTQQIRAKTARGQRGKKYVCIRENPQDMASNTSSSVRRPRASANGNIARRASSKRASNNCLRKASRASSLLGRPVRFEYFVSARSRSSSRRMVKVVLIWGDPVQQ